MNTVAKLIVFVEDRRFYRHWGVDPIAVLRAIAVNLIERRYAQGGSTITQQLARTLYLHRKKTLTRKIVEMAISFWLELTNSKDEIMNSYMSIVYLGHRRDGTAIRGFEEASRAHFNKPLSETMMAEQVSLVAMLKGPNLYHPSTHNGVARRTTILGQMLEFGLIDFETFEEAVTYRYYPNVVRVPAKSRRLKYDPSKPCSWCNVCPSSHCDCGPCGNEDCGVCKT